MAATDKPYRNQLRLDVVFGASCVALLLTTAWMMYDDHNRPFKPIQRTFRDVEEALYAQQLAQKYPEDKLQDIEQAREEVKKRATRVEDAKKDVKVPGGGDAETWLRQKGLEKARLEARYQDTKATYDSEVSLKNILRDDRDKAESEGYKKKLAGEVVEKTKLLAGLDEQLQKIQVELAKNEKEVGEALADVTKAEAALTDAQDNLKKLTDDFDRTAKLAAQKAWKAGDSFRAWPIIDGFASPYRINQVTLNDLTIDYGGFKDVPRYDRCTTCHLGIDRAPFSAAALSGLAPTGDEKDQLETNYKHALKFLKDRKDNKEALGFDPDDLPSERKWRAGWVALALLVLTVGGAGAVGYLKGPAGPVALVLVGGLTLTAVVGGAMAYFSPRTPVLPTIDLKPAQVKEYAAHPRLDLFVDANSPHPLLQFGCTTCHAGQGSGTEFTLAAHTPNTTGQKEEWEKVHKWEPFHDWEFPMLPARFVESSCLKCHHQVSDLVRYGSKEEAPKLLKGYNLIKDNGCFGCHEIGGRKGDKEVGPDLRLEPSPALENLTAAERAKVLADVSNPPGTLRKVGPSLRRLSEKTNEEWVRKWINAPRGFRPDTRMPHFYNLSNNDPTLKDQEGKDVVPPDQKDFPATEVNSIAYYLMAESRAYLQGSDKFRINNEKRLKELRGKAENLLSPKERDEIVEIERRLELTQKPTPVAVQIVDEDGKVVPEGQIPPSSSDPKDLEAGQDLFTERGCLACHSHAGTEKPRRRLADGVELPAVVSDRQFGPNLSRVAEKMVVMRDGTKDPVASRRWVIQWVLNPNVHHPRTRMPITHLKPAEAARVADWLLSQKVTDKQYQEWNKDDVRPPSAAALKELARVYLKKAPGVNPLEVEDVLDHGFSPERARAPLMAADADERELVGSVTPDKLKYYIGKKAVSRLGCFGCHDVPGFESAKPIGTPLNDWGKKDPARLAFEDIDAYVKDHYKIVDARDAKDEGHPGTTVASAEWSEAVAQDKKPYEKFFADALDGRQREGFLHQKLTEPRSYDYHRDVKWDDRLRMPQFKFAHPKKGPKESDDDFAARDSREEAEAREAVMTFVLGLVAEPVHARYLSNPAPDRLAEVKGRQVLEKFNCAGCHLVRPGVYDVKLDDDPKGSRGLLERSYKDMSKQEVEQDVGTTAFRNHNAWEGTQPLKADRLRIEGTNPRPPKGSENFMRVRLTDAVHFESLRDKSGNRQVLNIPASYDVRIDPGTLYSPAADPWGGRLADLLAPYLVSANKSKYSDEESARSALPPPLVREGERVQTDWLFDFLRNPPRVRPATVLRMPKFNMSEDEAQAIVNYFAAADKLNNAGIGLTYPYLTVPERRDTYWEEQNRRYVDQLAREKKLDKRAKEYRDRVRKKLDDATGEDKEALKALVQRLDQALAEKDEDKRKEGLAQTDLYGADGYQLLAMQGGDAICLKCHNLGGLKASDEQGPPLDLAHRRLRPDWTERWLGNPKRLFPYKPNMPQPFDATKDTYMELFDAPARDKVQALRDVLMNYPKLADLPANRSSRTATPGGNK